MNNKLISILKKYPEMKYICITNQVGIATKDIKDEDLEININIKNYLRSKKIDLVDFFISIDHFNSKSFLRKPNLVFSLRQLL